MLQRPEPFLRQLVVNHPLRKLQAPQ